MIEFIDEQLFYRDGYKYQSDRDFRILIKELQGYSVETRFISLTPDGLFTVRAGYAWDGASGPTWDTPSSMRGALVHDALYQLMRMGLLPQAVRPIADAVAGLIWRADGMWAGRARAWWRAVRLFAAYAARRQRPRVLIAPGKPSPATGADWYSDGQ